MDYTQVLRQLRAEGNPTPCPRMQIKITNARAELEKAMTAVMSSMGETLVWLPEYDKVAE